MSTSTLDDKDSKGKKGQSADELAKDLASKNDEFVRRMSSQYNPSKEEVDLFIKLQEAKLARKGKQTIESETEIITTTEEDDSDLTDEDEPTEEETEKADESSGDDKEKKRETSQQEQEPKPEESQADGEGQKEAEKADESSGDDKEKPEESADAPKDDDKESKDKNEKPNKDKEPKKEEGNGEAENSPQKDPSKKSASPEEEQRRKQMGDLQNQKPTPKPTPTPNTPGTGAPSQPLEQVDLSSIAKAGPEAVAQKASLRALYWAYGALVSVVLTIPAFIYLNVHLIASRRGSKLFAPLPIWHRAAIVTLDFLVLIALMIIPALIAGSMYVYCQTWSGWGVSKLAGVASYVVGGPGDFCKYFKYTPPPSGGASGGGGATGEWAGKIDFAVTSAYREGANTAENRPSAHGRGEAIDIALRNPTVPLYQSDPRIDQLVDAARRVGFVYPAGDVLDEYARPARNATGGHIHIEFNVKGDGSSYCDNGARIPSPPNDLVPIRDIVPAEIQIPASDPRVRSCMKEALARFFAEVEKISQETETE